MAALDTTNMNIYQKIAAIRSFVEVVRKNKSSYTGKYVSEDEILARVTAGMGKFRVALIPRIEHGTTTVTPYAYEKVKRTKDGSTSSETVNEIIVSADMTYQWINLDDPSDRVEVPWIVVGQQGDASQAVGSGLSYMNRYFLLKFFQIATPDDDPDKWRGKQQAARDEDDRLQLSEILSAIDAAIARVLGSATDDAQREQRKEVLSGVIRSFVKNEDGKPSGNYRKLTSVQTAADLLNAIDTLTFA